MREVPISYCLLKKGEGGFKRGVLTKKACKENISIFDSLRRSLLKIFCFSSFFPVSLSLQIC